MQKSLPLKYLISKSVCIYPTEDDVRLLFPRAQHRHGLLRKPRQVGTAAASAPEAVQGPGVCTLCPKEGIGGSSLCLSLGLTELSFFNVFDVRGP